MIVVTAGHVDHGKTSLVRSLTGTDTDRLPEEKKRGMSIDLGFAYLSAPDELPGLGDGIHPGDHSSTRQIAFVDVPGHEKFVRNMIAGVSAVDAALIVIAADDGPMPQTQEHLSILELLDVPAAIVAISKIDLVDQPRLTTVRDEVAGLLEGSRFQDALTLEVSVNDPQSVALLKDALLRQMFSKLSVNSSTIASISDSGKSSYFRMSIDRRFSITGAGTVVTGTVTSGAVTIDQEIYALTGQVPLRVRAIHAQSQVADCAVAGQRCALNITGGDIKKAQLQRGEWLSSNPSLQPVNYFDVCLTPSLPHAALKHWTPAHFHVGASDIPCRIALLDKQQASSGESAYARILCNKPAGVVHGDRFVLRDQSARQTIAGGLVIDPLPPRKGRSRPQRLEILRAMHQPTIDQALHQLLEVSAAGVSVNQFSLQFNRQPQAIFNLAAQVDGAVVTQPDADAWVLKASQWASLMTELRQLLQAWHDNNPEVLGADIEQLRRFIALRTKTYLARPVLADLLRHLCQQDKLTKRGAVYRITGREISLGVETEQFWKRILPIYQRVSPVAPRIVELAEAIEITPAETRTLLNNFVAHGRLYRVSDNRYFLPDDLLRLAKIAEKLAAEEKLTVAAYRDESTIGRNLVVELLEFFDRVQFTRRLGQHRRLLRGAEQVFAD